MKLELVDYTADNSDLKATIIEIWHETTDYYMVDMVLSNKRNGIVYQMGDQKLIKNLIQHWRKICI